MNRRFDSRVIVVAGGSTGIGLAVARRVASEGAVVIGARRKDVGEQAAREIKVAGGRAIFVSADVTVEAEAASLVRAAISEISRLDGAFNNAGGVNVSGPLHEIDGVGWHGDLTQNLTGVFYCMKAEMPAMLDSPTGGVIVNNASTGGVAGIPGMSSYAAAKHGVVGLTRSAALEYADRGLRVNALLTGNFDAPLYRRLSGVPPDADADVPAPNPTGRVASPEEVAVFVAFLLGEEAAFVTGPRWRSTAEPWPGNREYRYRYGGDTKCIGAKVMIVEGDALNGSGENATADDTPRDP